MRPRFLSLSGGWLRWTPALLALALAPNVSCELGGDATGATEQALLVDDSNLSMATIADVPAKRQQVINFVWGSAGFPAASVLPTQVTFSVPAATVPMTSLPSNLKRVDKLDFTLPTATANAPMKNVAYHFVPQNSNGRLVIVHQGHGVDFNDNDANIGNTIRALVAAGYGVLGAFMPCWNPLGQGPGTGCPVTSVAFPGAHHNAMFAQPISPPAGQGNTYRYFFDHLAISLNYLRSRATADNFPAYTDYNMVGISGGGWTTVVYAAMDPSVRVSVACSGSKPMYLRQCAPTNTTTDATCLDGGGSNGYDGDREQMNVALYQIAGYTDLYALAAAGTGRRHIQVQIRHDCCFSQDQHTTDQSGRTRPTLGAANGLTWNQAVRAYESKIQNFFLSSNDNGWYRYEIDETVMNHEISPATTVRTILSELEGDRAPFGAASTGDVYTKGLTGTLFHAPPSWANTGFGIVGAPAVIESGTTTHVLLRDPFSVPIHLTGTSGTSWVSEPLAGVIAAEPAATLVGNRLDVVAMGTDSQLYHWTKIGAGGFTREPVPGGRPLVGVPAMISPSSARLEVFARQLNGDIAHWSLNGTWSSDVIPGPFRGFPTAVAGADGYLRVYGRNINDTLVEVSRPLSGGTWSAAELPPHAGATGTLMRGSPSAVLDPTTQKAFVVTRAPNGSIDRYDLTSAWSHANIGMPSGTTGVTFAPVAVPGGVFARAVAGNVWLYSTSSNSWLAKQGMIF